MTGRDDFRCTSCSGEVQTRVFSGGEEWCCLNEACGADGNYPARVLPCFRCGKVLEQALPGATMHRHPSGGVVFRGYGNYGSTVYDPVRGYSGSRSEHLEINICDDCLKAAFTAVMHTEVRTEKHEHSRMWVPDDREAEEET